MVNIGLFVVVLVFHLAVITSLASIGNQMYHKVIKNKAIGVISKICVVVLMTICSFLIVLFLLDMVTRLIYFFYVY